MASQPRSPSPILPFKCRRGRWERPWRAESLAAEWADSGAADIVRLAVVPGTDVRALIDDVNQQAMLGGNIHAQFAGFPLSHAQSEYVRWVAGVDQLLESRLLDSTLRDGLRGRAYWEIRNLTEQSLRGPELISDEVRVQCRALERLAERLETRSKRLSAMPGTRAVLDTHVLLHFLPVEQIDWSSFIPGEKVRLVLPLRVIEELDEKKYGRRDDLAGSARGVLTALRRQLASSNGAPVAVAGREGVTIEVPIEDEPRRRLLDADQEILDECVDFKSFGQAVVLVTDDCGLDLRAHALGLEVIPMPIKYVRAQG